MELQSQRANSAPKVITPSTSSQMQVEFHARNLTLQPILCDTIIVTKLQFLGSFNIEKQSICLITALRFLVQCF